ncbi:MAG TPA: PAS domain-containing protein, partial [Pyrinomonadaceae bacterium]|nr:PAS domain-containing protein [Pyrinomonadaceae bacterium]
MSKPKLLLIVSCTVSLAVFLLLPSFTARAIAAVLLVIGAAVWLLRDLRKNNSAEEPHGHRREIVNKATGRSPGAFALGELFEATMSGMSEGLLVVDREMRVVASNPAAHRLFRLTPENLNARRLTELTRNPAIYSAFLDALTGTERSGVKVETHGPDRLIFDLRVVPLASSNGKGAEGALGVFIDVTRIEKLES